MFLVPAAAGGVAASLQAEDGIVRLEDHELRSLLLYDV